MIIEQYPLFSTDGLVPKHFPYFSYYSIKKQRTLSTNFEKYIEIEIQNVISFNMLVIKIFLTYKFLF